MKLYKNKKAYHEYFFLEDFVAGIELKGSEIKSIREGKVSFTDCYARIVSSEVWLINFHISTYEKANIFNHDPKRKKKLLLKKKEILKIDKKIKEQNLTLIPKNIFINDRGFAKVSLALAKGKKAYDKRETIKENDLKRELARMKKFE